MEADLGTGAEALGAEAGPREGFVWLSTGVRMHYVEQGRRDGPVLVLLHGYTDSYRSFDLDYPLLSRRYHVYALDQRGHGDSSRPGDGYSQSDFAADVVAFLDARGHRRTTLVGHSMGSFIAQQVALEYPQRVQALVLVGSAPTCRSNAVIADLKSAVDTLSDPIDPAFVRDFQASTFHRPIPRASSTPPSPRASRCPPACGRTPSRDSPPRTIPPSSGASASPRSSWAETRTASSPSPSNRRSPRGWAGAGCCSTRTPATPPTSSSPSVSSPTSPRSSTRCARRREGIFPPRTARGG
ncbi:alpha/beta fold hydrolase [Cystobacter fuscus]